MARQTKITAFFAGKNAVRPQERISPALQQPELEVTKTEPTKVDKIELADSSDEVENVKQDDVPMIVIDHQVKDQVVDDDDYDSDEVQKPRSKSKPRFDTPFAKVRPAKSPATSASTNRTPKAPKLEDGIIGMKVRSPTNGRA